MKRVRSTLAVLLGLTVVAAVSANQQPSASAGFTELQRVPLPDSATGELVMGLVERESASTSGRHHHPGGELGYVLSGSVVITTEDGSVETLSAGESFYQPPLRWHIVNTGENGAKTVVFRVVEKGQPMLVPVE